jgi:putative tryptophan/tyrosine transport system substrate-binding protein
MMNRRAFVTGLVGAVLAAPLGGEAQPEKVFLVGFLTAYSNNAEVTLFDSFRHGMRDLGYEDGRNITYQTRWAEGRLERLPRLAGELVARKVDVLLAASTPAALAAKRATKTIPIVITSVGDPVGTGLVDNLARPGGNITGNTTIIGEMAGKRLELLKELVPHLSRVAALGFPDDPIFAVQMRHAEAVARSLKVELFPVEIRTVSELDRAFETIVRQRADGVLRLGDPLVVPGRQRTSELAKKHRLPTMANRVEEVEAGLLMSYGPDRADLFRRAAVYVDKILKGAKPADLPVEQPTKFELVINLKTAKALGLTIPPSLLLRADHVIE